MKIVDLFDQLIYTHPVHSHTKKVIEAACRIEESYLNRIDELERNIAILELSQGKSTADRKLEEPSEVKTTETLQNPWEGGKL